MSATPLTMTTGIRHFTAAAIILDGRERVLLIHHNKIGLWLHPGGHIDSNEDPTQAVAARGTRRNRRPRRIIGEPQFSHPALSTVPAPFTILEVDVSGSTLGAHCHIDLIYICRPISVGPVPAAIRRGRSGAMGARERDREPAHPGRICLT